MDTKKLCAKYNNELSEFFGIGNLNVKAVVHDSWNDLAKSLVSLTKYKKAPPWLTGFAEEDAVHVLGPGVIPKGDEESSEARFEKTIKHEMAHIYYKAFKGNSFPNWLNEGVALYVAGQDKYKKPEIITTDILDEYHEGIKEGIYSVGFFVVNEIVKHYGKEGLFEIIKIRTDQNSSMERYRELKKMFDWLK